MRRIFRTLNIISLCFWISKPVIAQTVSYPWIGEFSADNTILKRISPPAGYERVHPPIGSYQRWLQQLPLKPGRPPVFLFNGERKANQSAHVAVVDIDFGKQNLQQCADAVIRLRAEYLLSLKKYYAIHFNFTSGHQANLLQWFDGFRPRISGNRVSWLKLAEADTSYQTFKRYLRTVFTYAGSYSLSQEMLTIADLEQIQIGDVFIQGGFPGHAVVVVDLAIDRDSGEKIFLLAQSYMPAQSIHILKNPQNPTLSPWYSVHFGELLNTPEWTFYRTDLKRFKD